MDASYALGGGQVHLWLLELTAPSDPTLRARYERVLDADEQARLRRFAFAHLRDEYLVSHALTRLILARYERVPPGALAFVRNPYGRPELSASQTGLRFNLSHAAGLGVLAITAAGDIGVDLEREGRPVEAMQIVRHYFAPAEIEWLRRQPLDRQPTGFIELWTLKEAYIKARGLGLTLALDQFAIDLADRDRPTIVFPAGYDDPADWQLFLFRPKENYALSLAVKCGATARVHVEWIEAAGSPDALAALN